MNAQTPRLTPNSPPHPPYHLRIPTRRQTYRLRKHRLFVRADAMKALPKLQKRNIKTRFLRVESLERIVLGAVCDVEVVEGANAGTGSRCESLVV